MNCLYHPYLPIWMTLSWNAYDDKNSIIISYLYHPYAQCAQNPIIWNEFIYPQPFVRKSLKIHKVSPIPGRYPGKSGFSANARVSANARARSRDSATRGQGGGSPPCTSCLCCSEKLSPGADFIPPLGALCGQMTHSPHTVPRMPLFGINSYILNRLSENHRKFTEYPPYRVDIRGILDFQQMLEQGPEIARHADRVGVLPLAPLAFVAGINYLPELNLFHLWAHCAMSQHECLCIRKFFMDKIRFISTVCITPTILSECLYDNENWSILIVCI